MARDPRACGSVGRMQRAGQIELGEAMAAHLAAAAGVLQCLLRLAAFRRMRAAGAEAAAGRPLGNRRHPARG
ncbi:hypothetical protein QT20_00225 [Staphylococcus aureus]|nr:hypothetical protein QT20_00225 [Staphylococcus aureus]